MIRLLLINLFLISTCLFAEEILLFTPPKDWKVQDPKKYSPYVTVAYAGKEEGFFRPTLNLAVEKNAGTTEQFLECVNKIQKKRPKSKWKKRSEIQTKAGIAYLFEDEVITKAGAVKILQAILVKDNTAYVLTGNCLVKDLLTYLPIHINTFKSLSFTEDLFSLIEEKKREEIVKDLQTLNEQNFASFQEKVEIAGKDLGTYWQLLVLKESYKKIAVK